jgi:hypothetical protein
MGVLNRPAGSSKVVVPNLGGRALATAEGSLASIGLKWTVVHLDRGYNGSQGVVLAQVPASGSSVQEAASVQLNVYGTLTNGPTVALPNLVGLPEWKAENAIGDRGLTPVVEGPKHTGDAYQMWRIVSQDPRPGTELQVGVGSVVIRMQAPDALIRSAAKCAAGQVRVSYHGSVEGAGSVNQLFWIRNVSDRPCSLASYARVSFVDPHSIFKASFAREFHVRVGYSIVYAPGQGGNDVGGLAPGHAMPRAILSARGGVSSFWIYGTDMQVGAPPYYCIDAGVMRVVLPGTQDPTEVHGSYYFCGTVAVHPVVPGRSGAYPARPLSQERQ